MKKLFVLIISSLLLVGTSFSETILSTYKNPSITNSDIIDTFVEEINKNNYAYAIYDWEVYKSEDDQNYAWAVNKYDATYESSRSTVLGNAIQLCVSNGVFTIYFYGADTQKNSTLGVRSSFDLNNSSENKKFWDNVETSLKDFVFESRKWLKKYNKSTYNSLSNDFAKICFLSNSLFGMIKIPGAMSYLGDTYYTLNINDKIFNSSYSSNISNTTVLNFCSLVKNYPESNALQKIILDKYLSYSSDFNKKITSFSLQTLYSINLQKQVDVLELSIWNGPENKGEKVVIPIDFSLYLNIKNLSLTPTDKEYISSFLNKDVDYIGFFNWMNTARDEIAKKEKEANKHHTNWENTAEVPHKAFCGINYIKGTSSTADGVNIFVEYNYNYKRFAFGGGVEYVEDNYSDTKSYNWISLYTPVKFYILPLKEFGFFLNVGVVPGVSFITLDNFNKETYSHEESSMTEPSCDFRVELGGSVGIFSMGAYVGYNVNKVDSFIHVGCGLGIIFPSY